ncbi:MAG: hypothetical protein ACF8PN_05515 [Phycisphaerales bacterium]
MRSSGVQLSTLLLAFVAAVALDAKVAAQIVTVDVFCVDKLGNCEEILNPDPVFINVGEQVDWNLDLSCGIAPCSGRCEINVPPGPGFPGYNQVVNAGNLSPPTDPFLAPGVFPYRLECSPPIISTIIVGDPGDIELFASGNCPGMMTATATDATPGDTVYFIYGFSAGSTAVPGCGGLSVDLNNPKIIDSIVADENGNASITGFAPPAACGAAIVQAVETGACRKSNTFLIPDN